MEEALFYLLAFLFVLLFAGPVGGILFWYKYDVGTFLEPWIRRLLL